MDKKNEYDKLIAYYKVCSILSNQSLAINKLPFEEIQIIFNGKIKFKKVFNNTEIDENIIGGKKSTKTTVIMY